MYLFSIEHGVTDECGTKDVGHGRTELIFIANQRQCRTSFIFTNLENGE